MSQFVLYVEGLGLRAASKRVLADVCFQLPAKGMTALMGPVGAGKSTLLKWLTHSADPAVYSAEFTHAEYLNCPLCPGNAPPLYAQRLGLSLAEMMTVFDEMLRDNPAMICVDEPTAQMTKEDSVVVMDRLQEIARDRCVLLVTHNQTIAEKYADYVMLIAGGRLQEFTPARQFFSAPQSEAGQQFLGSGSVAIIGIDTPEHHVRTDLRKVPFSLELTPVGANDRLRSVVPDRIFVLDCPEDGKTLSADADALREAGLTTVVSPVKPDPFLSEQGLTCLVCPPENAARCKVIAATMAAGEAVVFHRFDNDADVPLAVAQQLIYMSVPADRAAAVAAELLGFDSLDPISEQELWDFELALSLEADGVKPEDIVFDEPKMTWPDNDAPIARAARG